MLIEFDPAKRDKTLYERGLYFADAAELFFGTHFTAPDYRVGYGELRFISVGVLQVTGLWFWSGPAQRSLPDYFYEVCP